MRTGPFSPLYGEERLPKYTSGTPALSSCTKGQYEDRQGGRRHPTAVPSCSGLILGPRGSLERFEAAVLLEEGKPHQESTAMTW
jgi:hypothetical protein